MKVLFVSHELKEIQYNLWILGDFFKELDPLKEAWTSFQDLLELDPSGLNLGTKVIPKAF